MIYDATALRGRERIAAYFRAQCARERLSLDEPDVAAEPFRSTLPSWLMRNLRSWQGYSIQQPLRPRPAVARDYSRRLTLRPAMRLVRL
ncbi:MAG: hypothetical protein KBF30_04960 [Hyphomonadaceae bacterium]|nr:hypothetical protein [Hyphomonadaceae bacterium]MBP9754582.1 hypothetical protein [Phenylobacterium sp.]